MKQNCFGWGFYAHKFINGQAIYSLPESPLLLFFKQHKDLISANAIKPDQRRYVIKEEACRHYIDLDVYKDSVQLLPKYYAEAEKFAGIEKLQKHGVLPWHINKTYYMLVKAMKENNADATLKLASDLGHYIADAHVPLHTTHNYDGQLTNQKGIHSLWETRVPELLSDQYDLFVGKAEYIHDVQELAWKVVKQSHEAVDSVLKFEAILSKQIPEDQKYCFEERNGIMMRTYSPLFSEKYSLMLNGQVERRMQQAIKALADLWYTAWIDAGQPAFLNQPLPASSEEKEENEPEISTERFLESRCNDTDHNHLHYHLYTKK